MKCEVKYKVWSMKCEVKNEVKYKVWSKVWSMKCEAQACCSTQFYELQQPLLKYLLKDLG